MHHSLVVFLLNNTFWHIYHCSVGSNTLRLEYKNHQVETVRNQKKKNVDKWCIMVSVQWTVYSSAMQIQMYLRLSCSTHPWWKKPVPENINKHNNNYVFNFLYIILFSLFFFYFFFFFWMIFFFFFFIENMKRMFASWRTK